MPKLIINRKRGILGAMRRTTIFIDGADSGSIKMNETKEYELPIGKHTLQAKLGTAKTDVLEFNLSDTKSFQIVQNKFYSATLFILFLSIITSGVELNQLAFKHSDWVRSGLLTAVVAVMIYFLTLGRKKVMRIEECDWMN